MSQRLNQLLSDAKSSVHNLMIVAQGVEGETASNIMRFVKRLENAVNDIEREIKLLERANREGRR
jgi:uncharacterized protein Yka (UPF0111/DUF47 family)